MFLHDEELRQVIQTAASPVREENFGSISYDLTIRGFVCPGEDGRETDSRVLDPGESVFASSEEVLTVPDDCVGFVTLRNFAIRMGLSLSVPVYQPGHVTRVFARLTNVSDASLVLEKGDSVVSLMFSRLDGSVETPYRGRYADQLAFSDDKEGKKPDMKKAPDEQTPGARTYPACFYPAPDGTGFTVTVPDLPGCVSSGKTFAEAVRNASSAAGRWLHAEYLSSHKIPQPNPAPDIRPDGFVRMLVVPGPDTPDEAWPKVRDLAPVRIDLPGLVRLARRKKTYVFDLTDEEKNRFISGGDIDTIRDICTRPADAEEGGSHDLSYS